MKEKQPIESRYDKAFSRHRRTSKNTKDLIVCSAEAVMASDSAMLNPCAKRKKLPTIDEQFSDNDWKIVR